MMIPSILYVALIRMTSPGIRKPLFTHSNLLIQRPVALLQGAELLAAVLLRQELLALRAAQLPLLLHGSQPLLRLQHLRP